MGEVLSGTPSSILLSFFCEGSKGVRATAGKNGWPEVDNKWMASAKEAALVEEAVPPPPMKLTRQLTGLADLSTMADADPDAGAAAVPTAVRGAGAGSGAPGPSPGKIRKIGSPHTSRTAATASSTATLQQLQPPQPPPAASATGLGPPGGVAPAAAPARFRFVVGGCTDPGPGPVNQDNYFVWEAGDGRNMVVIVLDGHGRELGQPVPPCEQCCSGEQTP